MKKPHIDESLAEQIQKHSDTLQALTKTLENSDTANSTGESIIVCAVMLSILMGQYSAMHNISNEDTDDAIQNMGSLIKSSYREIDKLTKYLIANGTIKPKNMESTAPTEEDLAAVSKDVDNFLSSIFNKGDDANGDS